MKTENDNTPKLQEPPPTGLLPGMAMVAIYMLFVGMVGGFGALNGRYPGGRYVVLIICSLVVVGVFGFLRLKRWGWALVAGGALSLCLWSLYMSHIIHNPGLLIMAGLNLCLFLYLIRTEVRDRVH
jgi:hypothetical protein